MLILVMSVCPPANGREESLRWLPGQVDLADTSIIFVPHCAPPMQGLYFHLAELSPDGRMVRKGEVLARLKYPLEHAREAIEFQRKRLEAERERALFDIEAEGRTLELRLKRERLEAAKAELMKSGIDIDAWCRWAYWHGDPYDQVTDRVRDLVEVADVLEAALFAQINAPLIADQVGFQAIETARAKLDNRGVSMVLEALGQGVEVGR